MRTKEGVGRVAPRRERVLLSDGDLAAARRAAEAICEYRRYRLRTDDWGQGYFGDPAFPLRIGLTGEFAFRRWADERLGVALEVDTTFKPRGDGDIDFVLCGYGVQVKTAATPYDRLLIRTRDAAMPADELPFKWDVCVRVQWPPRDSFRDEPGLFNDGRRADWNAADLCGVVWRIDFLRDCYIDRGRGEGEWNYAVDAEKFLSMSTLADKCFARMTRSERDAR